MGVYSNNRIDSIGNIQVEAAEGYQGGIGVQLAMIESYENDLALFDGVMATDFQEAGMVLEGAGAAEVLALQEGAVGDFLGKIKEFFVKLWAKLKGIFQSFMAKFDSVVMKDSKAFHEKYAKQVYGKDLSKMKAKYSAPKNFTFAFDIGAMSAATNKPCLSVGMLVGADVDKLVEDLDRDELICNILKECSPKVSISDVKDYDKDVHEACFEDEDEKEGFADIIHSVGNLLVGKPSKVETIKKANDSLEKAINTMIKDIEKSRKTVIEKMPMKDGDTLGGSGMQHGSNFGVVKGGDGKSSSSTTDTTTGASATGSQVKKIQKALNYIHQQATAIQAASGKFTTAALRETKFEIVQARRIFAAAVAHNPKAVKESAVLEMAMQEAAEYEVVSAFEAL